jgi:mannan endo-1,4-beta-mannosidase
VSLMRSSGRRATSTSSVNRGRIRAISLAFTLLLVAGIAAAVSAYSVGPPPRITVGVYEPDDPGSYTQVSVFAAKTGYWPGIVSYYSNWGMPFESGFASAVWAHHRGKTLVQIDPRGVALSAIAAGQDDGYLHAYAAAVRKFGHPVILSFGQEMNGNWYPWGAGQTPAPTFVAAWRHIVTLFRAQGVRNVVWLWDVNCDYANSAPIGEWWPGQAYVTWVGIDCYYAFRTDTFARIFTPTIDAVRQITQDPIMIAETAIAPGVGPAKMADLFDNARRARLVGLLWFDQAQDAGAYHQDWRLEDNPAMMGAFRAAVKVGAH